MRKYRVDCKPVTMENLIGLLVISPFLWVFCSGSHSLWMKVTYIRGETPFPELSAYMVLDDIEFGYYDSNQNKIIHRDVDKASDTGADAEDMDYVRHFVEYVHGRMKKRVSFFKNYFNHTNDVYVFQRAAGCELLDNDKPGIMTSKDAYNAETVVEHHYNRVLNSLHIERRWSDTEDQTWLQSMNFPWLYRMIYHPNCIKFLKKHLAKERNRVMKKVKPRIRLFQKILPGSAGVLLTCLATGFYPRHINLTLLRDGQPVSDHQMTGGELLPNGDETYQMRRSLEVRAEELHHHHYTCTAEHLSLDNKLDFGLEYEPGVDALPIVSSVLVLLVLCGTGAAAGFIIWKRRHKGTQTSSLSSYTATPNTEVEDIH